LAGILGDTMITKYNVPKITVRRGMQVIAMFGMSVFMMFAVLLASNIYEGMIYISIAMGLYNFSFAGKQIMEQICQE
jgi:hypothetical protein